MQELLVHSVSGQPPDAQLMSGVSRLPESASGYFRDARLVKSRLGWLPASEKSQRRLRVDCRRTRPTADRQPNLWLWFSEKVLRRPAAFRRIADAHADSVIGS